MNANLKVILLSAAISVVTAYFVSVKMQPAPTDQLADYLQPQPGSIFNSVAQTKNLRCGYIVLPPEFNKDPNTGKFSGFSYDAAMELGKRLGWNVQWTEEVNFMTMAEGLRNGRFDALCFSLYRYSPTAAIFEYSIPLFYTGTGVYVRAGDSRFDQSLAGVNSPSVTVAAIDSEMSQIIARENFPNAKIYSMPQNTDLTQMMVAVESGKADVAFANGAVASPYLAANPGKLKDIATSQPIRVFSHGFAFKKGERELADTVNYVFEEMHNDGTMEKILSAHEKTPHTFLRANKNYAPINETQNLN